METEADSKKQILKSSSIIGGASVINILIGLFKIKLVAVLLGPAGIGLIGLLNNLMAMVSNVAAMGTGTSGTRQIAEANAGNDRKAVASARRALFFGTLVLAGLGGLFTWIFKEPLATWFLSDKNKSEWVGWLSIGIVFTVAAGSQNALLTGMRRVPDLAKLSIYSSAFATIIGVTAVWFFKEEGLLLFIISMPLSTFILGHLYVSKLPKVVVQPIPLTELKKQWHTLLRLGFAFMGAGLIVTLGQLAVRTLVQNRLGFEALGLFEASWVISMTYIGFVLSAMGTDYYPRLTGIINDHSATTRLVNEQTEIALLFASPILLAMLTLAPWVLVLLYSNEFSQAAQILRWQVLGDVLKILSWPLGYVILASGAGKTFLLFESLIAIVFFVTTWFGLDYFGIEATGISFFVMYLVYLPMVYFLAKYKINFSWNKAVIRDSILLFLSASCIIFFVGYNEWIGFFLGLILTCIFSIVSFYRIANMGIDIAIVKKTLKVLDRLKYR